MPLLIHVPLEWGQAPQNVTLADVNDMWDNMATC